LESGKDVLQAYKISQKCKRVGWMPWISWREMTQPKSENRLLKSKSCLNLKSYHYYISLHVIQINMIREKKEVAADPPRMTRFE